MDVLNLSLYVNVDELSIDDPQGPRIYLKTTDIKVPIFGNIEIDATAAAFYLEGEPLDREDAIRHLFDLRDPFWVTVSGRLSVGSPQLPWWAEDELEAHGIDLGGGVVMITDKKGKRRYPRLHFTLEATHVHFEKLVDQVTFE
ncbi:MAG: hypothetical protein HY566_03450 [Candidatus Kerfeldbacteria bacterium]|nr:hypothetical protein [Candidatus Kerfeldbacteria bacterium]